MTSKAKFPLAVVAAGMVGWVAGCDRHVDLRDEGFPPSASQGRAGAAGTPRAGSQRAGASGAAGVGGGSAGASGAAGGSGAPDAGDGTGAAGTGGPTAGAGAPAAAGAEVAGTAGAAGSAGSLPAEPTPTPTPPIQAPASPPLASGGATTCGGCAKWGEPVPHGELPSILPEASGLAASARYPGVLYTHNDSGDSARFFMMDETAKVIAEMRLPGATAVDWEDIALGPCPRARASTSPIRATARPHVLNTRFTASPSQRHCRRLAVSRRSRSRASVSSTRTTMAGTTPRRCSCTRRAAACSSSSRWAGGRPSTRCASRWSGRPADPGSTSRFFACRPPTASSRG